MIDLTFHLCCLMFDIYFYLEPNLCAYPFCGFVISNAESFSAISMLLVVLQKSESLISIDRSEYSLKLNRLQIIIGTVV